MRVLLLSTLDTKVEETQYLRNLLSERGVATTYIDTSLICAKKLDDSEKLEAIINTANEALETVNNEIASGTIEAVIGLGGGTGGEIALSVLRRLPMTFPKVLVSPLPFDPRREAADASIITVPTIVDISGLNPTLREIFNNVAALVTGLCCSSRGDNRHDIAKTIGITALGTTASAVDSLTDRLKANSLESTIFHANGFGGVALTRFAKSGYLNAIVDLTPHELTRMEIAGEYAAMPDRFKCGSELPRIVLPGALNFLGLGKLSSIEERFKNRKMYRHSGNFTHVALSKEEMEHIAKVLATNLNALSGCRTLIVPLGGFSLEDRPGGAIYSPELTKIFYEVVKSNLSDEVNLMVFKEHIFDKKVTDTVFTTLNTYLAR